MARAVQPAAARRRHLALSLQSATCMAFPPRVVRSVWDLAERERKALLAEMVQVKGLLPLLMKRRNRQKWNAADLRELQVHLKRLSKLSPYVVVFVMPGGFAMLPVLAWWLDRRRQRNRIPPPTGDAPGPQVPGTAPQRAQS